MRCQREPITMLETTYKSNSHSETDLVSRLVPEEGLGHRFSPAGETRDPASRACARSGLRVPARLLRKLVPEEGLEPSSLARRDFESRAYTIPPLRPRPPWLSSTSVALAK